MTLKDTLVQVQDQKRQSEIEANGLRDRLADVSGQLHDFQADAEPVDTKKR